MQYVNFIQMIGKTFPKPFDLQLETQLQFNLLIFISI